MRRPMRWYWAAPLATASCGVVVLVLAVSPSLVTYLPNLFVK